MEMAISQFLLVLGRLSPLFLFSALTPFGWVPLIARVVLACGTALMVSAVVGATGFVLDPVQPLLFAFAMLREVVLGAGLALAVVVPGAAIAFSARLIDVQSGMAAASLLNPATHIDESLMQLIMRWAASATFFTTGLHLDTLRAFVASFTVAPAGDARTFISLHAFTLLLSSQFLLGLLIAAPVVVGLFCIDVVAAHISRSMPQANIYFVALPVKLVASLMLLAMTLRNVPSIVLSLYRDAFATLAHGGP